MNPHDILEFLAPEFRATVIITLFWALWRIDRRLVSIETKLGSKQ